MTEENIETKKELGTTSFKNSKQKKRLQAKKDAEVRKTKTKDSNLKVKIKNLEKELQRIAKLDQSERDSKKVQSEKKSIEEKLPKLRAKNEKLKK